MDKNLERFHPMKRILILQQDLTQYAMTLIQVPNYIQQKTLIQQMQIMLNKFDLVEYCFCRKKADECRKYTFGFKDKISQIKTLWILDAIKCSKCFRYYTNNA